MKLWKRWTAAVLAAAMALLLLAACGPSGPSAPDTPEKPGSSETSKDPADPGTEKPGKDPANSGTEENGKDPAEENTGAQKKAAVVEALNTVRKSYGKVTMDAEVCAMAEKMAQLQLDGLLGKYGSDPMKSEQYTKDWNAISKQTVKGKKLVGVGGYGAYPTVAVIRNWAENGSTLKKALVMDESATLVGVGVVQNTDPATKDKYPIMVVVMIY